MFNVVDELKIIQHSTLTHEFMLCFKNHRTNSFESQDSVDLIYYLPYFNEINENLFMIRKDVTHTNLP